MIRSFQDLDIYKESFSLVLTAYTLTKKFPRFEQFELASQIRRASVSIPANIAEGWAKRRFIKEFKHHLDISLGSCQEIQVHFALAQELEYVSHQSTEKIIQQYDLLGGKIYRLRENWK